jgi:hypothetical protein
MLGTVECVGPLRVLNTNDRGSGPRSFHFCWRKRRGPVLNRPLYQDDVCLPCHYLSRPRSDPSLLGSLLPFSSMVTTSWSHSSLSACKELSFSTVSAKREKLRRKAADFSVSHEKVRTVLVLAVTRRQFRWLCGCSCQLDILSGGCTINTRRNDKSQRGPARLPSNVLDAVPSSGE